MRVLLLEDDPVFARALTRAALALGEGWEVSHATRIAQALDCIAHEGERLQLALVDMALPDGRGLEVIAALQASHPDVPALVVSTLSGEADVLDAIRHGARGYVHKSEPEAMLTSSMRQVLQGHYPISPSLARYLFNRVQASTPSQAEPAAQGLLTPKESETLRCIAQGLSYGEAAARLGVSLSTVQSHIRALYRKLQARSQVQAVVKAREKGLL